MPDQSAQRARASSPTCSRDAAPELVLAAAGTELPARVRRACRVPTSPCESARSTRETSVATFPRVRAGAGHLHLRDHRPAQGRGALPGGDRREPRRARRGLGVDGRGPARRTRCRSSTCTASCSACSGRCAAAVACTTSARLDAGNARGRAGATLVFGVPTQYHRLADQLERDPGRLPPSAGPGCWSPARPRSPPSTTPGCGRATGLAVRERYGLTETLILTAARADDEPEPGSVGRPLPGTELRLVPVPESDDLGTVEVRGPSLFDGYLNRVPARARRVVRHRRHRPLDGVRPARAGRAAAPPT